ncbi:MAG: hypothetical protein JO033_29155 [Acidobacteriaceae bacterium]|nr:hypothetical protein [Acidobacteriaceae bacterium]
MPIPGEWSQMTASRSGCGYGSGRSSRAFTTLKIALLAPIPIAREIIIAAVAFLRSIRAA